MTVSLLADRTTIASGAAPLEALAGARERLIDAEVGLRLHGRPGIARSGSGMDCRALRSGSEVEMYVEAELQAGHTLTWWLEITWNREWNISARLLRDDDDGQSVEREFADRSAAEANAFIDQLALAIDEVVESIENWIDRRG